MELLGFFIQEFEVRSTLILNVFGLISLILPVGIGLPFVVIFLLVVVAEVEVLFFGSLFTICDLLVTYSTVMICTSLTLHRSWQGLKKSNDAL